MRLRNAHRLHPRCRRRLNADLGIFKDQTILRGHTKPLGRQQKRSRARVRLARRVAAQTSVSKRWRMPSASSDFTTLSRVLPETTANGVRLRSAWITSSTSGTGWKNRRIRS